MDIIKKIISYSRDDTENTAKEFSCGLKPGDVVGCIGELGAGKTCFISAACRYLGVVSMIHSPSYTIVNSYRGKFPVFHIDFYRIASEEDLFTIGYNDILSDSSIIFIEWADKFPGLIPKSAYWVKFTVLNNEKREILFYKN
ncbi:MAG: tRNA (adenosine(37)-N6)-threonylcarbamoyltransferase complex ATPase subunit type 1 TsaE [bacterium]